MAKVFKLLNSINFCIVYNNFYLTILIEEFQIVYSVLSTICNKKFLVHSSISVIYFQDNYISK